LAAPAASLTGSVSLHLKPLAKEGKITAGELRAKSQRAGRRCLENTSRSDLFERKEKSSLSRKLSIE
jgi:hypothetical protein